MLTALLSATLDAYPDAWARRTGRKSLMLVDRRFAQTAKDLDRHTIVIGSLREASKWHLIDMAIACGWEPPVVHEIHLRLSDAIPAERDDAQHYAGWLRHILAQCRCARNDVHGRAHG
jgi:hypothetical protein